MTDRKTRPVCGECVHFRVDHKRTPTPIVGGLCIRYGVCEVDERKHDRCRVSDCPDYVDAFYNPGPVEVMAKGRRKSGVPCMCLTDGKKYRTVRDAERAYGYYKGALKKAMWCAKKRVCNYKGMQFVRCEDD